MQCGWIQRTPTSEKRWAGCWRTLAGTKRPSSRTTGRCGLIQRAPTATRGARQGAASPGPLQGGPRGGRGGHRPGQEPSRGPRAAKGHSQGPCVARRSGRGGAACPPQEGARRAYTEAAVLFPDRGAGRRPYRRRRRWRAPTRAPRARPGGLPGRPPSLNDLDVYGLDAVAVASPRPRPGPAAGAPYHDHARPLKVVGALGARVCKDAPAVRGLCARQVRVVDHCRAAVGAVAAAAAGAAPGPAAAPVRAGRPVRIHAGPARARYFRVAARRRGRATGGRAGCKSGAAHQT